MEFREFMTDVQDTLSQMQEQDKTGILVEIARTLPEIKREKFLDFLKGTKPTEVSIDFDEIEVLCQQVEDGDLYFDTKEEEYYEEGAWELDFRTHYLDTMKIIPKLTDILNNVHTLVFQKEYEQAYKVLQMICSLTFQAVSEWYDDSELSLWKLMDEKLLLKDKKDVAKDLLYSCSQWMDAGNRPAELYKLLNNGWCADIRVMDLMAYGPEEIHDADAFMESWIAYLRKQPGDRAAALLEEACIYVGDISLLSEIATQDGATHPYLFKALCSRYVQKCLWQECLDSAVQGLQIIPKNLAIRGEIADYGIVAAGHLGAGDVEKMLVEESFLSQPIGSHFMRIFLYCDEKDRHRILGKISSVPVGGQSRLYGRFSPYSQMEMKHTGIESEILRQIYQAMLGDFESGYARCLNDKNYLGWTESFQGIFVPLMLLYFRDENATRRKADYALYNSIQRFFGIQDGDVLSSHYTSQKEEQGDFLRTCFRAWKASFDISKQQRQKCLELLRDKVARRTEAVVGGGYRSSYYKAAELIVVMGEIEEDMGERDGARKLAEFYRAKNSRKSAFRGELNELLKME